MSEKHYSIAIVGNRETILGFKALGLTTAPANNSETALLAMTKLKNEKIAEENQTEGRAKYAIIFITEELAKDIPHEDYKKLSKEVLPAIIPIPSGQGATGFGLARIGKMIEQAVGSDIFG